jgi:hypothetical protein
MVMPPLPLSPLPPALLSPPVLAIVLPSDVPSPVAWSPAVLLPLMPLTAAFASAFCSGVSALQRSSSVTCAGNPCRVLSMSQDEYQGHHKCSHDEAPPRHDGVCDNQLNIGRTISQQGYVVYMAKTS